MYQGRRCTPTTCSSTQVMVQQYKVHCCVARCSLQALPEWQRWPNCSQHALAAVHCAQAPTQDQVCLLLTGTQPTPTQQQQYSVCLQSCSHATRTCRGSTLRVVHCINTGGLGLLLPDTPPIHNTAAPIQRVLTVLTHITRTCGVVHCTNTGGGGLCLLLPGNEPQAAPTQCVLQSCSPVCRRSLWPWVLHVAAGHHQPGLHPPAGCV
jgi:hypothetical protein